MCGIVGQIRGDRSVDRAALERMCAALEHRGPDSRGTAIMGRAGIGIQRLRVIDLETGDQPIYNEDGSVAVVLNGEIYNYLELRQELERAGHRFATRGDTEVIVHLYEQEGHDCVKRLHGMFAFALWDDRRQQLLLARDRVGKKPLFYHHAGSSLSFASELNALMADIEVPTGLDHAALDCYFAYGYVPAPMSAFKAVRKLPPATTLIHRGDAVSLRRYWRLDYGRKRVVGDREELHEELRDRIRAAVRRRLLADVPLGAFLSGGIDSSAVVGAMAETSGHVKTFSVGFSAAAFNELPYARRIADQFSTDHHEFLVEPDALGILPIIARQYGEPFADPSAVPSYYLAEVTRRHVTVALNGDGGDESFAGYERYRANLLLDRLSSVPGPFRRATGGIGARLSNGRRINSLPSKVRRLMVGLGLDGPARYTAYMSYLDGVPRDAVYTDEYRQMIGDSRVEDVIERPWQESTANALVDRMLDVDIRTYLPGDLLVKMDIATMAHSLEGRSPLLDHELMEFAAGLPAEMKIRGREKKVLLRDSLRGWIPDEILDRPKQGFELPIAQWFRTELREFARETLLDATARQRGYFKTAHIEAMLDRHVAGREDNARGLWTLLMFEMWHREVVDRLGARTLAAAGV